MAQIGFKCPNGEEITFENCFKKCKMGEKCVSLPTLKAMAVQRVWNGRPSTTQLLAGTRYAYLKIVKDYYESVQKLAFILLGNKVHSQLEDSDTEGTAEIAFKSKTMSGITDYYDKSEKTLWDYKTSGSFKVKKALGLVSYKIDDPAGGRYKRSGSGYKKGDIKQVTAWRQDPSARDFWEFALQTNRYAIWIMDEGLPVEKIKIEIIVRDGGLKAATMSGVSQNIIVINIPILNREYVLDYYDRKAKMLRSALAVGWSPKCTDVESWGGRKCLGYCPVSHFCEQMPDDHVMAARLEAMQPEILI